MVENGKDDKGRFVYVLLAINYAKILLASIYAPNTFDDGFLPSISSSLLKYNDSHSIITGDFNATVCPEWDRSSGSHESIPPSSVSLRSFMTDLNIVDIWRLRNDKVRAYSFYSGRHGSSSRIDYIFISPSISNNISHISMLQILISDRGPVACTLQLIIDHPKVHRWRFNNSILSNDALLSHMKQQLSDLIGHNRDSCSNAQTLWETTKCFIRGVCIGFSSKLHSGRNKCMNEIERETERLGLVTPSVTNTKLLTALRGELHSLSLEKAEFILHRTKQRYYYDCDRPCRLLPLRLKQYESKAKINAIRTTEGTFVTQPDAINKEFKTFYCQLYLSEGQLNAERCASFLYSLSLSPN